MAKYRCAKDAILDLAEEALDAGELRELGREILVSALRKAYPRDFTAVGDAAELVGRIQNAESDFLESYGIPRERS